MKSPQRAFTIVELMVSIAVIAVILGILLPVLGGVKKNAKELAAMAHQREVGSLERQYGFDRQDSFPYFGITGTDRSWLCFAEDDPFAQMSVQPPGEPRCIELGYWDQSLYWQKHMRFLGYDAAFVGRPPELELKNNGEPVVLGTIDWVTWAAYAPPSFFQPDSPKPASEHRVQSWASVAFPSDKVILRRTNYVRTEPDSSTVDEVIAWLADGHVERMRERDMGAAVKVGAHSPGDGSPGLTTLNGLNGRDR